MPSNVRPPRLTITPAIVRGVLQLAAQRPAGVVSVPILPVRLVDRPRPSAPNPTRPSTWTKPRAKSANDDAIKVAAAPNPELPVAGVSTADSEGGREGQAPEGPSGAAAGEGERTPANACQPRTELREPPPAPFIRDGEPVQRRCHGCGDWASAPCARNWCPVRHG